MRRAELITHFEECLAAVPDGVVRQYGARWAILAHDVNELMAGPARREGLIGDNELRVMMDNHACHARFIHSVLVFRSGACLVEVVAWVYRSYIDRGFAPEYFPRELESWQQVIIDRMGDLDGVEQLLGFYEAMRAAHTHWLDLASEPDPASRALTPEALDLLEALLDGDESRVEDSLSQRMRGAQDLPRWWQDVVTPALHTIGAMWAAGEVTIAEEHIATAIARRALDRSFPHLPRARKRARSAAVVVTPGERHAVGAQLVADTLRLYGFQVFFTGADTPASEIVALVDRSRPDLLILSTTVPMNLAPVAELIRDLRASDRRPHPEIIVGGQAWAGDDVLWQKAGADACIRNLDDLLHHVGVQTGRERGHRAETGPRSG